MRSDRERLLDIQEAIDRIGKYTADQARFATNELVQTWVVHHLQIIGEAARAISPNFGKPIPNSPGAKSSVCVTF